MPEITLSRECYHIADDLAHRIERAGFGSARQVGPVVEGWTRVHVAPLITEREEAVSRQFELEEGRRTRIAHFLRKVAAALEGS